MFPQLPIIECPQCKSRVVFFWSNGTDGICEACWKKVVGNSSPDSAFRVLVSPTQASDGRWIQRGVVHFAELRQYIDHCLNLQDQCYAREQLTADSKALQNLIEILASLVRPVPKPEDNAEILPQLKPLEERLNKLTKEWKQLEQSQKPERKDHRLVRPTPLMAQLRQQIGDLISQIEVLRGTPNDDRLERQRGIVVRIRRDFEKWNAGTLNPVAGLEIRRVPWRILAPAGHLLIELQRYCDKRKELLPQGFDEERLKLVLKLAKPDEPIYEGLDSFDGYLVFEYKRANKAVLECGEVGNALFIMNADRWRLLSTLSKAELLDEYIDEIVSYTHVTHGRWNWERTLHRLFRRLGILPPDGNE